MLTRHIIRSIFKALLSVDTIKYDRREFQTEHLGCCDDVKKLFEYDTVWAGLDDLFTADEICDEYGFSVSIYLSADGKYVLFVKTEFEQ